MRLDGKALALATGIVFAAFSFVIAVTAVLTGVGREYLELVGGLHPGYTGPTFLGACIQTFWMFVYGLIGGGLLAAIYNYFAMDKGK